MGRETLSLTHTHAHFIRYYLAAAVLRAVVSPMIFVPNQLVGAPSGTDVAIDCNTEAHPKYIKNPFLYKILCLVYHALYCYETLSSLFFWREVCFTFIKLMFISHHHTFCAYMCRCELLNKLIRCCSVCILLIEKNNALEQNCQSDVFARAVSSIDCMYYVASVEFEYSVLCSIALHACSMSSSSKRCPWMGVWVRLHLLTNK